MNTLAWIIGFTLLGGVAGVLLASLFLLVPENSRRHALPFMVAFATGALLAAALLGLLPEAIELAGPDNYGKVGLSLLGGIALFFVLEKLVLWRHCHEDHCETHSPEPVHDHSHGHGHDQHHDAHRRAPGVMIIIGDTMHNALDGVLIAAAFLIDVNLGIMTGLAVLAHEVPSEVGNFAIMLHSGMSRARAFAWNLFSALGSVLGGLLGYLALSRVEPALPYALGVSAASLLHVAVADLIPGLHRRVGTRDSILQVILIAAGVALVALVEHLNPH
ncbi:MAG: ZIP family metal transporter [Rhodanobacteraceae bacterium]|nr:ZIP family metal transporter [Rhodanobacteraceae bacterium]